MSDGKFNHEKDQEDDKFEYSTDSILTPPQSEDEEIYILGSQSINFETQDVATLNDNLEIEEPASPDLECKIRDDNFEIVFMVFDERRNIDSVTGEAILPKIAEVYYQGDACIDLFANCEMSIPPGESVIIGTNIKIKRHTLPPDSFMCIKDRSSIACQGVFCIGGVIDLGYTGELKIVMFNSSKKIFEINPNDRIAQFYIPKKIDPLRISLIDEKSEKVISETSTLSRKRTRGDAGFGSTNESVKKCSVEDCNLKCDKDV